MESENEYLKRTVKEKEEQILEQALEIQKLGFVSIYNYLCM